MFVLQTRASVITNWESFLHYRAGQMVLQSRTGITKFLSFYYKVGQLIQSWTTFFEKWGRYYKVGQLSKSIEGK